LYCNYPENRLDQSQYELIVPYSTIKICSQIKKQGVKEVLFVSGERPDNFAAVRARLDLWGFSSYIEYVYTICELVFLEGMIPSIDIGYMRPEEMQIIRRISANVNCMLDTVDPKVLQKYAPKRTVKSRLDVIKAAGEGKVPITTGILVGLGESEKSRKEALSLIKGLHQQYGHIQNVVIQNYIPEKACAGMDIKTGPTQKEMLDVVKMARDILPEDIAITVPAVNNENILPFIKLGVRDIGRFDINDEKLFGQDHAKLLASLEKQLKKEGLGLQRRLPIFSKYIAENWYSRKLAQVLDRYKALLTSDTVTSEEADDELIDETPKKKPAKKSKKK
jgi:FO synthase subunit 1